MADKIIRVGPGTYDVYDVAGDTTAQVTVPTLTAGSISNAAPEVGDTLTVTGANASSGATYQWQSSADGSTGWTNETGATSATFDTTGATEGLFWRRGVADGEQATVYTAGVEVVAGGYTPEAINFTASTYGSVLGLTAGDEINAAFQLEIVDNTNDLYVFGDSTSSTHFWYRQSTNDFVARWELTNGANVLLISTSTFPNNGDRLSVFVKGRLIDASTAEYQLYINNTLEASSTALTADPASVNFKMPQFINGAVTAGQNAAAMKLIGGLIIFNSGGGSLSYANFFDGSNNPTFDSATVNSQSAIFFQNTVAGFNAGTNAGSDGNFTMTGTVT